MPFAALAAGAAVLSDFEGRYQDVAVCLAFIPFRWGEVVRRLFYSMTLEAVGRNVIFGFGSFCQYRKARLGNNVSIGCFTVLGEVTIGDNIVCGGFVLFMSGNRQHGFEDRSKPIAQQPGTRRRITIGNDVWVGSKAIIMADVGTRCVIAAGAVVVDSVNNGTVVGGNPARVLRIIGTAEY